MCDCELLGGSGWQSSNGVDKLMAALYDDSAVFLIGRPASCKLEMSVNELQLDEDVDFVDVFSVLPGLSLLQDLILQV